MIISSPIITIDGPSGVGKGALSKILSEKLRWNILDSGVIYRMLAIEVLSCNITIDVDHKNKLIEIAERFNVEAINDKYGKRGLDKKFIEYEISSEVVGDVASKLAVFPEVRKILLAYQRNFHQFPGLVANGRDMGTVVFPNASFKVFLDASCNVRCERRLHQLRKKGIYVDCDYVLKKIKERDNRDYTREIAPLIPANDSFVFNSTYLTLNEIVYAVLKCFYNSYI